MPSNNFNNQSRERQQNNNSNNQESEVQQKYSGILNENIAVRILNDKDGKELFKYAEEIGEKIAQNISVSQIRKIFSEVKKLNNCDDWEFRLKLIRAQIGYTAGRFNKIDEIKGLKKDLFTLIDKVEEEKHLKNFINFFEAVIAYHRAYGGN